MSRYFGSIVIRGCAMALSFQPNNITIKVTFCIGFGGKRNVIKVYENGGKSLPTLWLNGAGHGTPCPYSVWRGETGKGEIERVTHRVAPTKL
jgi:hypothetical protein